MKIAKLILHYNTPKETSNLLKMVSDAIVVNNGSKDHFSREIYFQDNLGFVKNWNRIIRRLMDEGEYDAYWLMNSDIEISRKCVQRVQKIMDTGKYLMLTPAYNCWMKQCQDHGTGNIREIRCIEFTAPIIHRIVFEKIGLFDERFNLGSGVDFDFCLRAQKAAIKLFCDDGSTFNHIGHKSISNQEPVQNYSERAKAEMYKGMMRKYGINWKKIIKNQLDINNPGTIIMKKVAVYTTIFGGYDNLLPIPTQNIPADYFCISDASPAIFDIKAHQEQWKIIEVKQPRKDLHPVMRAKWYKVFPWELEELRGYEVTIFIDGCVQIISADFISFILGSLRTDIAVFKHPERNCIFDEVKASEIMTKYQDESIHDQAEYYRKIFPEKAGLYACTVIARRNTERTRALMMSWFHENMKFTWQDQLSFPVVCRVHKVNPDIIPGNLYQNPYFKRIYHADKEDQKLIGRPDPKNEERITRNDVMNYIIEKMGYKKYLEVGLRTGYSFDAIECQTKHSIDPKALPGHEPTFLMTSDEFFGQKWREETIDPKSKYDMIFIDGDHNAKQVWRDFENSYLSTPDHGCIIMHDTNPPTERFTKEDRCGTAYQVLVDLMYSPLRPIELYTLTIPQDEGNGISIIFKGENNRPMPHFEAKNMTELREKQSFKNFDENRKEIANLVDWNELKKIIDSKAGKLKIKAGKR